MINYDRSIQRTNIVIDEKTFRELCECNEVFINGVGIILSGIGDDRLAKAVSDAISKRLKKHYNGRINNVAN